jgi:hypothetical protein
MAKLTDSGVFSVIAECHSDDVRENYSGRGMYGATCVGFTGSVADLVAFVIDVAEVVAFQKEHDGKVDPDLEIIQRHLCDVEIDSMGRDSIFYWPTIQTDEG